ncbi:MAG TPA: hypothetical protein VLF89_07310 [Candidatus Saccharimonadales bacterium]|nr:hypothetical protein [Candidatus Saccharimonadales bacterium]
MTKKDIRKLAELSYETFDEAKIMKLAAQLNRKDLKEYIRQLKFIEKKNEVIVALPDIKSYNKGDNFFETLFNKKRIIYQEDASLILGARITDNDIVYDINLRSKLEEVVRNIELNYE